MTGVSTGAIMVFGLLLLTSGCVGTIRTRGSSEQEPGAFAGKYPYEAVAADVAMVGKLPGGSNGAPGSPFAGLDFTLAMFGVLSIPCDLCFDTILLPADLVAWPCGCEKRTIDQLLR